MRPSIVLGGAIAGFVARNRLGVAGNLAVVFWGPLGRRTIWKASRITGVEGVEGVEGTLRRRRPKEREVRIEKAAYVMFVPFG